MTLEDNDVANDDASELDDGEERICRWMVGDAIRGLTEGGAVLGQRDVLAVVDTGDEC